MLGSILACQIPGAQLSWRTIHHVFLRSSMSRNASRGVLGIYAVYPAIMQVPRDYSGLVREQQASDAEFKSCAGDVGWFLLVVVVGYFLIRDAVTAGMLRAWDKRDEKQLRAAVKAEQAAQAAAAAKRASRGSASAGA